MTDRDEFRNQHIPPGEPWKRSYWLGLLLLIAMASIGIRLLTRYDFDNTELLYIGVPFLFSLAIAALRPARSRDRWWHGYRDHALSAMIVFLSSSIVLFEGFICMLFFMPIYFLIVSIVFLFAWHDQRHQRGATRFVSVLPLLILVTALEGTTDTFSFDRQSHVVVTKVADMSRAEIVGNLTLPFNLQRDRGWLLSVFPMPYHIAAGSLEVGDVHRVYTRYHRWFTTNTHEGELHLEIVDVAPNHITTRFIHDTTFFASYLTARSTEISLTPISSTQTEITLRINYERKLDPAWYFHPLQQLAVTQMAEFLNDEVMIRK